MAIIAPYGDPSAHGKVTPGLAFRRLGPRVTFGANRRPRNKNTPAQQTQRDKIRQAVAKYRQLNFEEKVFLRRRGAMLSKNIYNLYISSQLKGNDWSKIKGHQLKEINDIVLFDSDQPDTNDMLFELECILGQAYPDNINLYNNLDSETAGVITSGYGPNLIWAGTPSHVTARFDKGIFSSSNLNYVTSADNGAFFKELFNKSIFACWFTTEYDVTGGKPVPSGSKYIMTWSADAPPVTPNIYSLFFNKNIGLTFRRIVGGVTTNIVSTDSAITYTAGEMQFILVAVDRDGIDGTNETLQIWYGNETTIKQIVSDTTIVDEQTEDANEFTLLNQDTHTRILGGTIDNVYTTDLVTNKAIEEQVNGRNIEKFNTPLGNTWDNENRFTPGEVVPFCPELRLKISNLSALDWRVPFYWPVAITWSNDTIDQRTTIIRLPLTDVFEGQAIRFYISQDMSAYFDRALFRLGGTDNV